MHSLVTVFISFSSEVVIYRSHFESDDIRLIPTKQFKLPLNINILISIKVLHQTHPSLI